MKNVPNPSYQNNFEAKSSVSAVYTALTKQIPKWWTEDFTGYSDKLYDEFTVRFSTTFKTMKVIDLKPNERVIWTCIDTLIDIPELQNKTEWKGTTIIWEFNKDAKETGISMTHLGLTPKVECYNICEKGWESFLESLKSFLETGKGMPYTI